MQKFNSMNLTLFSSLNAEFKVSIEASFSRKTDDGGSRNLVYITSPSQSSPGGYGVMNPSVFLVFSHTGEKTTDDKKIYTSYPHIYKIRKILGTLVDWIGSGEAYVNTPEGLIVKPEYATPFCIDRIGRNNKWISFGLSTFEKSTDTVVERFPGVRIEMSEAPGAVSILTEDDLCSIYGFISTLDLPGITVSLSLAYLDSQSGPATAGGYNSGYSRPAYNAPSSATGTSVKYGNYSNGAAAPSYRAAGTPVSRAAAPTTTTYRAPTTVRPVAPVVQDHVPDEDLPWDTAPASAPSPVLSPSSVGTPESTIDFDDEDSIAKLFSDEN